MIYLLEKLERRDERADIVTRGSAVQHEVVKRKREWNARRIEKDIVDALCVLCLCANVIFQVADRRKKKKSKRTALVSSPTQNL